MTAVTPLASPPNSYNLSQTFRKVISRSFLQPRSEGAKMRQSCFLSAAPRANVFPPCDPSLPGMDSQTCTATETPAVVQNYPLVISIQFYTVNYCLFEG